MIQKADNHNPFKLKYFGNSLFKTKTKCDWLDVKSQKQDIIKERYSSW